MSGEQLRPLENRPYLDQWQKRQETLQKPTKPSKVKPRKKSRKKARE